MSMSVTCCVFVCNAAHTCDIQMLGLYLHIKGNSFMTSLSLIPLNSVHKLELCDMTT